METAKWICVGAIDITQLSVAGKASVAFFLYNTNPPSLQFLLY
jgi:hypothetical protein